MLRILKILIAQFRKSTFTEFINLVFKNMYFRDPILIYQLELGKVSLNKNYSADYYTIKKGKIKDLNYMKRHLNPLPWEFQCHNYDHVTDFFIAQGKDGIQHISWIYYANDHNRILFLNKMEAEIKFCLTLPSYRGKGIYPHTIIRISQYLFQNDIKRVFMCASEKNKASIRGIEKAGFHLVGKIVLIKILGVQVSKKFNTSEV